jgi:phage-related minor tail protein
MLKLKNHYGTGDGPVEEDTSISTLYTSAPWYAKIGIIVGAIALGVLAIAWYIGRVRTAVLPDVEPGSL